MQWGIMMKSEKIIKTAVCFFVILIIASLGAFSVFADNEDVPSVDIDIPTEAPIETEPVYTDPEITIPPQTEAPTEPSYETQPPTEVTTQNQAAVETEPQEPETQAPTQVQNVEEKTQPLTLAQTPTVEKTVSKKKYSTNAAAGIVSWISVGIGLLVASIVLLSTKISGRRASGRRV